MLKPVYTIAEVAAMSGYSRMTVTRLFENEPGIHVISRPEKLHKRSYRSIRIPKAVYLRVMRHIVAS